MKDIMKNVPVIPVMVLAMIFIMMSSPISANETVDNTSNVVIITYRSDVDQDYGFYRVIDYTTHKPAPYDDKTKTLTINVGDTVEWINDATPDEPLTIISKDGLWGNRSAYLRWNYQRFSYTFNQSGTYQVYIKEYPREQHQTIVVKDISIIPMPTITLTANHIINKTENIEDNLSNVSTINKSRTVPKNGNNTMAATIGIIILVIYIIRSGKK